MINRCLVLLAVLGSAYGIDESLTAPEDAGELADLWKIADPSLLASGKAFTWEYPEISTQHVASAGAFVATFYDPGCKEASVDTYGTVTSDETCTTGSPCGSLFKVAKFARDADTTTTVDLDFEVQPKDVADVPALYDGTNVNAPILMYCVRFGLTSGGQEINFLETLVNITIGLTGNFETETLTVEPKKKGETQSNIDYQVAANLCGHPANTPFNQGSVVSVCIVPGTDASNDGIIMDYVSSFTWLRLKSDEAGNPVYEMEDDGSFKLDADGEKIQLISDGQPAVNGNNQPANALTFIDPQPEQIKVSSVLYASFFATNGKVKAKGSATMKFPNRRLGAGQDAAGRRRLEEDVIPPSPFDISAGVVAATDEPVSLQTAAGPSQSYALAATIVGLVSAVLLA